MVGELRRRRDRAARRADRPRGRAPRGRRGGRGRRDGRRSSTQVKRLELHGLCCRASSAARTRRCSLYFLSGEMIARADVSCMAHHSFHGGMAMAMLVFSHPRGDDEVRRRAAARIAETRFAAEIEEIARGDAWGCMDITEPDAGSDMARAAHARRAGRRRQLVRHRAEDLHHLGPRQVPLRHRAHRARPKDRRTIRSPASAGSRCSWCTTYDDLPDGTRKRYRHARARRGEARAPRRRSPRALDFERAPAELIGKRGEGFKYMLTAHEQRARSASASSASGSREAAYRHGARPTPPSGASMGKPIDTPRDDRRLPRRDAHRRPGAARAGGARRVPRGDGAEARAPRALRGAAPSADESASACARARRTTARGRGASRRSSSTSRAEKAVEIGAPQRADPRRRRLHEGVRRREAAARRAGHADLRGHEPDPVAHGDEGHARAASSSARRRS